MRKIILIGGGGHALSCIDVIEHEKKFKIVGIVDDKLKKEKILNYKVIGGDTDLKKIKKNVDYAFITVGQIGLSNKRRNIFNKLKKLGFKIPIIISPKSMLSKNVKINEGTIIHHGVAVNSGVTVGKNCIINTNCLLEHGVKVGDHTHIATSVVINGDVRVGSSSFIGSGAIIRNSLNIGSKAFIPMGKIVIKNIYGEK
jgi:sugar O-acyltransferase (sialic acid O-acetyltransferase NeuD family)